VEAQEYLKDLKITNRSLVFRRSTFVMYGNRYYSTSNISNQLPIPVKTISNLNDKTFIYSCREKLKNKGGIYCFVNTVNDNRYLGSAKDLYLRFNEHLNNNKSNVALQKSFVKYGLDKFHFCIYEYFVYENKVLSNKLLTDLETSYIKMFNFDTLYNFKTTATSSLGYKHTEEAKLKMKEWYEDRNNHPMFGKTHTEKALNLISKPGELNPMYGKKHSELTKAVMSEKKNKYLLGVGIYDLDGNLVVKFKNNIELAIYLNITKVTVGKYLNGGLVYNNKYLFKVIKE